MLGSYALFLEIYGEKKAEGFCTGKIEH